MVCLTIFVFFQFLNKLNLVEIKTYFIGKRRSSYRIVRKPPQMTSATAAAVAVALGVSLSVPLNDASNIPNESGVPVNTKLDFYRIKNFSFKIIKNVSSPLLEEVGRARRAIVSEENAPNTLTNEINVQNLNERTIENEEKRISYGFSFFNIKI
jgi:hypothetical protein